MEHAVDTFVLKSCFIYYCSHTQRYLLFEAFHYWAGGSAVTPQMLIPSTRDSSSI